jgi:hypothetical protein
MYLAFGLEFTTFAAQEAPVQPDTPLESGYNFHQGYP